MNTMQYLGNYKITPFNKEIEVDCFGHVEPYEAQTLEHPGCTEHAYIEEVKHGDVVITDYLSDGIHEQLEILVNKK